MRLTLTGRHVEITPALGRLVEKKMARIERLFSTRAVSGQVELWPEKFRHVVEVHVHARGGHMLKGRAVATSWDEALSQAVDRVIQQGQTLKGKWEQRKREARPVKRSIPEPQEATTGPADRPGAALPGQAHDDRRGGPERAARAGRLRGLPQYRHRRHQRRLPAKGRGHRADRAEGLRPGRRARFPLCHPRRRESRSVPCCAPARRR